MANSKSAPAETETPAKHWQCKQCLCDDNWSTRQKCRLCGTNRPKQGKNAGKGKGTNTKLESIVAGLAKQQQLLQAQLSKVTGASASDEPKDTPSGGELAEEDEEKRQKLQNELIKLKTVLSDEHPEVTKRERELAEIRRKRPLSMQLLNLQRRLAKVVKREQTGIEEEAAARLALEQAAQRLDKAQVELQKIRDEKKLLMAEQGDMGLHASPSKPNLNLPDALQVFSELVGQMGALNPQGKSAFDAVAAEAFQLFGVPLVMPALPQPSLVSASQAAVGPPPPPREDPPVPPTLVEEMEVEPPVSGKGLGAGKGAASRQEVRSRSGGRAARSPDPPVVDVTGQRGRLQG
eukprot:4467820-Amphidinium_carterae.3